MIKRILAASAAIVLTVGLATPVVAVAAAAPEPPAIGVCVAKAKPGAVRGLERADLAKSRYGKCTSKETKATLVTVAGLPSVLPKTIVREFADRIETCKVVATVGATQRQKCTEVPVPAPSPSPSPSVPASPTS